MVSFLQAINAKILSLNYGELIAEIKSVDAQESFGGGVLVLVTGYLTGKDNKRRDFTQSFFLAPQDNGYFVLNDLFRYVEDVKYQDGDGNPGAVSEVEAPVTPEQGDEKLPLCLDYVDCSSLYYLKIGFFFGCMQILLLNKRSMFWNRHLKCQKRLMRKSIAPMMMMKLLLRKRMHQWLRLLMKSRMIRW